MFPTWRASWFSEDFNKRIDEALFEQDEAKQVEMYEQLQRDHMEKGPFTYMFQLLDTAAHRNTVTNWPWNAFRVYYANVEKG
jgi:peptide/nickel transport system substrate-binding protein